MPRLSGAAAVWVVLAALILSGCSAADRFDLIEARDLEYKPGRLLNVYAPRGDKPKPVVILLHGAGLDRTSYEPFARRLAEGGAVVFNIDWNVLQIQIGLRDVACALGYAGARSSEWAGEPARITLVAHSTAFAAAGAVAMATSPDLSECAHSAGPAPAGFVGISPFSSVGGDIWPRTLFGMNPRLRIRLIEGVDDSLVRDGTSQRTVAVLNSAGYEADVVFVGGGHFDIVLIDIDGPPSASAADETIMATLEVVQGGAEG